MKPINSVIVASAIAIAISGVSARAETWTQAPPETGPGPAALRVEEEPPDYPLGVTFAGRAWSEHKLLRLAYAYEQASNVRKSPPGLLAL